MRRGRPAEFGESVCMWDPAPGDTQMVVLVNPLPHCFYWMKFCQISFIKCGKDSQAFLVASALATGPEERRVGWKKPTTVGDMILQTQQRLLSIRSLLWTNLCIFTSPKVSTAAYPGWHGQSLLVLIFPDLLTGQHRQSQPHPHNSSAGGGRELNNNWVGWSLLMENISVWSVHSNKEFNSIHSCVFRVYQNISN